MHMQRNDYDKLWHNELNELCCARFIMSVGNQYNIQTDRKLIITN